MRAHDALRRTLFRRLLRRVLLAAATAGVAGCAAGEAAIFLPGDGSTGGGGGTTPACVAASTCEHVTVDPNTGACLHVALADGTACDDGSVCTSADACTGGACHGTAKVCPGLSLCGAPPACDPTAGCAGLTAACTPPPALALGGCACDIYWVQATLGAGAPLALIVDTGSSSLGVASSSCTSCGVTPTYTPSASAHATGATAQSLFGAGNVGWSGPVYHDAVTVAGGPSTSMNLAAITAQAGFFTGTNCVGSAAQLAGFQGILGLGPAAIEVAHTDAFLPQLAAQTSTPYSFAVQLCDAGGSLWVGGFDPAAAAATVRYTPLLQRNDGLTYAITVSDMAIGGVSLGVSSAAYGDTDVDTGTTELLLPAAAYNALIQRVQANATFAANFGNNFFGGGACAAPANGLTRAQLDQMLPALTVTLPQVGGGTFTLSAPATQSYMGLYAQLGSNGQRLYCGLVGQGPPTILGAAWLRSQLAVFAVYAQQMGFATSAGCSP